MDYDESVDTWLALLDDEGDKAGEELKRRAYLDNLCAQPQILAVPACKRTRWQEVGFASSSTGVSSTAAPDMVSTASEGVTSDANAGKVSAEEAADVVSTACAPAADIASTAAVGLPSAADARHMCREPTIDYTIQHRSPRGQLEGYIAVQAGLLVKSALHVGKCFKIGITTDPYHRLRNPAYGYYRHEFAYHMSVLCRATKAEAERLEIYLIKHLQERSGPGCCRNKHEGGGGIARDAREVYVYIVFFRYVVPGIAKP